MPFLMIFNLSTKRGTENELLLKESLNPFQDNTLLPIVLTPEAKHRGILSNELPQCKHTRCHMVHSINY